jgi:hypothetical protein
METNLFPLELFRRTNNPKALEMARANCQFYLDRHPQDVFFEVENHNHSNTGMCNDACYGRLAKYTDNRAFYDVFVKQIQKLNLAGMDLRAGNNIRNMYWDCTPLIYAIEECPELRAMSMAKLAFLCEHTLGAQKESGALWHRYAEPGVVDRMYHQNQDGAATSAMIVAWAKMYDVTGDPRWLDGIRKAIFFAVGHQYPATDHPYFAGAFEYEEDVMREGHRTTLLRGVSTALGLRSMLVLLKGEQKWAKDFWA